MNDDLTLVTDWLLCASSQIGPEYFQLPVAGAEESEYRERVYCYELYHRWRCHWPDGFPFSLSGEVDKAKHRLIRNSPKPDFLVHIPGLMVNLLIIEVKPQNAGVGRMADDLKKLTYFRRDLKDQFDEPANYYAAYFWVYGLAVAEWPQLRDEVVQKLAGSHAVDYSLISCFVHEGPGMRAIKVGW